MTTTHIVDVLLFDVGILENLLDGLHGATEEIHIEFFELGTGERLGQIVTIFERLDFDTCALLSRECPLCLLDLAFSACPSP